MPGHVLLFPVQGATAADLGRRSRRARRRGGRRRAVPDGADADRTRTYSWDDPLELLSRDCRHVRDRGTPPDRRRRAAAAPDREDARLRADRGRGGAGHVHDRACGVPLQPDRRRPRRARARAARLRDGVRGALDARGRRRLHDARGEGELRAAADLLDRARSGAPGRWCTAAGRSRPPKVGSSTPTASSTRTGRARCSSSATDGPPRAVGTRAPIRAPRSRLSIESRRPMESPGQMESLYKPDGVESRWQELWEAEGLYAAGRRGDEGRELRHLRAAAERHRRSPPRPCAERLDPGRPHPLAPHAGLPHALAARLRPRGNLDAERRREAAGRRRADAPRPRPRGVHRAHVGVAREDGADDHGPVPAARRVARLQPRAVHARRRVLAGRDGVLRAALEPRLDLPRQPDRQLVPVPPDRDLRPRGRARRDGRRAHLRALPVRRTETGRTAS